MEICPAPVRELSPARVGVDVTLRDLPRQDLHRRPGVVTQPQAWIDDGTGTEVLGHPV